MTRLLIEVLGPLHASMAGQPVTALESVKVRALLAYLAVESDRPHTRQALVGLLWPDFSEESARHNLRQALFNLRKALGDTQTRSPFLKVTRGWVQFNRQSDYSLDLDRFNHYFVNCINNLPQRSDDPSFRAPDVEEMVKLYRGEFLQQLMLDDSAEFENWLLVKRENLHQQVLEAHTCLVNYYMLHADFSSARRHAARQLELDPWREEAHRQLMRALALDGQRSAALAQYETCKQVLAEELDVEPSDETRQLYEQIRLGNLRQEPGQITALPGKPVNTLPLQLTPFVGRESELRQLGAYLSGPECRCLTLIGPGGMGKTRLALQLADNYQDSFSEGAVFISLASVSSMVGVIPAIMNAMNISFYGQSEPKTYLLSYLCSRQMLLILDNVEHLLDDDSQQANIIPLILGILEAAPQIKLLVTSREALNMQGEFIFDVQGLAYPQAGKLDGLATSDAVTLFVQRARRASPQFTLNARNQADIARICRLVEGMPLALELAATWTRVLSPAEIASEIENSLDFLSSTLRDLPERHRSMRVVFDHSWQMLSKEEQQALVRLSIFRGGFHRRAAEQVAGATLSILSTLVNRTLLRRTVAGRYDLHELVRQYCANQLELDPQTKMMTEEAHYAYFLAFVQASEPELHGPNQLDWLERLEQEHDNIRRALAWALEGNQGRREEDERALRLASAMRWFWRMHGHFREGCDWLTKALQYNPDKHTQARASALLGMSLMTNGLGDLRAALPPVMESIVIYKELQEQRGLAEALLVAGITYLWQGEARNGYAGLSEALAIYRKIGDQWGEAHALYRLGSYLSDYEGDPKGRELLKISAAILDELGDRYLQTSVLISLGIIDLSQGEFDSARQLLERSLATTRAIKHPWGIADALTNLGCLYRTLGEYTAAQAYFEEALDVYQRPVSSVWQTDVYCAMAENAIDQGDFLTAHAHLQAAASVLGASENKWLQVVVLYFRGLLAYHEGKYADAASFLEEDIPIEREGRFKPDLARSLVTLGRVKVKLGELQEASGLVREGLALFAGIGHKLGMVCALEALAEASMAGGDNEQAIRFYAPAQLQRQSMGTSAPPVESEAHDSLLEKCRNALGAEIYSKTWEIASAKPLGVVVRELLKA